MGRRTSNIVKDMIDIGAALPWWLSLLLAAGAYLLFHNLAGIETGAGTSAAIEHVIPRQFLKATSIYAQYGVPILLLLGTVIAFAKRKRRGQILSYVARASDSKNLDSLTWEQFEDLVHEYFRQQGYAVSETSKGPDGGIDLNLRKDGKTATVQCKHWRNKKVGPNIIREQFGIMVDARADESFVVTSGQFTEDAYSFAKGKPMRLIDGDTLRGHLGVFPRDDVEEHKIFLGPTAVCPRCGSEMKLRTAHRGRNAGSAFWGCSRFPKCRGTRTVVT
jgi:restriction system protein